MISQILFCGLRRKNMIDLPGECSPEYFLEALSIEFCKLSSSQCSKIGMLHNNIADHFGLERALESFKDLTDTWKYQLQHILYSIDHCPCCPKMHMMKIPIHDHGYEICINGMLKYRLYRSISGSRTYPGHSRYFHSLGRIVSFYAPLQL